MEEVNYKSIDPEMILDCAQPGELCFWADKFKVSPLEVKTAIRACCSNSVLRIASYLQKRNEPQAPDPQRGLMRMLSR